MKRLVCLLLQLLPALILPRILHLFPAFTEAVYSQRVFRFCSRILQSVFGVFPFSFAELLLYALLCIVPATLLFRLIRACLGRLPWVHVLRLVVTYCTIAVIAFNAFYWFWGFNHARPTLASLLALEVKARPVEELSTLCDTLLTNANALRQEVAQDENGVFMMQGDIEENFQRVPEAYQRLKQTQPLFDRYLVPPKMVRAGEGLSILGISGIYIPFTAEANVNCHQPDLLILLGAAHESAHALGIAREDEANFAGYLACMASDDKSMQYSGVMHALIHASNALYKAEPDAYRALYARYCDGILRDLEHYSAYWQAYEGPVQEAADRANDKYLKFNNQTSGIQSYGEMVNLLLAWQAQQFLV